MRGGLRSTLRAAYAQHAPASSRFSSLKAAKFDNNVPGFSFLQKFDRMQAGEGIVFRSQPSRNIRALHRLRQNAPKLLKVSDLTRPVGYPGPLPALHRSQTDIEGVSEFGWCQSKAPTQLTSAIHRERSAVSLTGRSGMPQHRRRCRFRLKHDARVIGTRLADQLTELYRVFGRKASRVVNHHVGTCRLEDLEERAKMIIVRVGQVDEYGLNGRAPP